MSLMITGGRHYTETAGSSRAVMRESVAASQCQLFHARSPCLAATMMEGT